MYLSLFLQIRKKKHQEQKIWNIKDIKIDKFNSFARGKDGIEVTKEVVPALFFVTMLSDNEQQNPLPVCWYWTET